MDVMMVFLFIGLFLCGLTSATNGLYSDPHCEAGRVGIVHLFEWRWIDIEKECLRLATLGFCGVQISVPTEHLVQSKITWIERYMPVSYDLVSRSGNEEEFSGMVKACTAVGMRIFVTLQLDNMSPGEGKGYNGTPYNATALDYPGVPYNASHFHTEADCSNPILSSSSPAKDMQDCWVLRYPDVDQANPHVRYIILKHLNKLVAKGVAGFFLVNSMHIDPEDIEAILEKVDDVECGGRPFMTYEMVNTMPSYVDPSWYYPLGRVTDFSVSEVMGKALLDRDLSGLCHLFDPSRTLDSQGYASLLPPEHSVVFVHNEDYQRGLGPQGVKVVTFKNPELFKLALSFLLASGYGIPRVMSSYSFTEYDQGPPIDTEGNVVGVPQTKNGNCGKDWICEHRYPIVKEMLKFNSMFLGTDLRDCKADKTKVSFSRGDEGHFWAILGPITELMKDLPKVKKWDKVKNNYIEELRSEGLTVFEFGDNATAAFYTEQAKIVPTPTEQRTIPTIIEQTTTILTTTKETITVPKTIKQTKTIPTTTEQTTTAPTTTEQITIVPTTIEQTTTVPTTTKQTTTVPTTTKQTTTVPTTTEQTTTVPTTTEQTTTIPTTTEQTTTAPTTTEQTTTLPTTTEQTTTVPKTTEQTTTVPTTTKQTTKAPTITKQTTTVPTTTERTTTVPTTTEQTTTAPTTTEQTTTAPTTTEQTTTVPTTTEQTTTVLTATEQTTTVPTTTEQTTTVPTTTEQTTTAPTTTEQTTTVPTTTEQTTIVPTTTKRTTTAPTTTKQTTTVPTTTEQTTTVPSTTEQTTTAPTTTEQTTTAPTTTEQTTTVPTTTEQTTTVPTTTKQKTIAPATTEQTTTVHTSTVQITNSPISTILTSTGIPASIKKTTTKKPESTNYWRETIIFLRKETQSGDNVYIMGGNPNSNSTIPIKHMTLDTEKSTDQRNNWADGDHFLDWIEREPDQGKAFHGVDPKGTPAQWTTNDTEKDFYTPLNKYGDHYWLIRVEMDCRETDNGFFEFRGAVTSGAQEPRIPDSRNCIVGQKIPPKSDYHIGICGKVNIYSWGQPRCQIKDLN